MKGNGRNPEGGHRPGAWVALVGIAAAFMVLLGTTPAFAATIHVGPTGNDASGSGSAASPYRSVGKGLAEAAAGDVVRVAAGTYSAAFGEVFPLALKGGVTLEGAGSASTRIQGAAGKDVLVLTSAGTATVRRLAVSGGARGMATDWAGALAVSECLVSGCDSGVEILGSGGSIADSTIQGNTGVAVYVNNAAVELPVSRCVIQDNGGVGVSLFFSDVRLERNLIRRNASGVAGSDGAGATMADNVVVGNRDRGVYTGVKGFARLTNDTVADNGGAGIAVNAMSGAHMKNCVVWGNASAVSFVSTYNAAADASYSLIQGGMAGTGNISSAPVFAGAGDYRLAPRSPGIDAGTAEGAPAVDKDGAPRPRDGDGDGVAEFDMGAYELQPLEVRPGRDVVVELRGVRLTFSRVLTTGTVEVVSGRAPKPGMDFRVRGGAAYGISTTCTYSGPVTVTVPMGRAPLPPRAVRLYQKTGRHWRDITTAVDARARTVTGVTNGL